MGAFPDTLTFHKWRRSTSAQFELKRTELLSGASDHCSTSQFPGVRSFGVPPSAERAYKCCQPSSSEAITNWLLATQLMTPPPVSCAISGNDPCGVALLRQISFADPCKAPATPMAQECGLSGARKYP